MFFEGVEHGENQYRTTISNCQVVIRCGLTWYIVYPIIREMEFDLLTINEVRDILKVSRKTLNEYVRDEKHPLPVIRITAGTIRIKRTDLEKWLEEGKEVKTMTEETLG